MKFWPGTRIRKSTDNAFTGHITQPRSQFVGDINFRTPATNKNAEKVLQDRFGGVYGRAIPLNLKGLTA